jgi:exodeoxyribonuclease V beta subunit
MKPLDLGELSLEAATTLIEASAGTGKTYSITGLILRLLLEKEVTIGQIVAVTFTEAATKELRDRTRGRLSAALHDLRAGKSEDAYLRSFMDRGDMDKGIDRLTLALKSFDEAQIFTIHGFCQRCLGDYAFESGVQFGSKLSADPSPFFEEVARDFWRLQFYGQNQLLAAVAISGGQSPEQWVKLLERSARHPDLVILPPAEVLPPSKDILVEIEMAFADLCGEWKRARDEISRILRENRSLSRAVNAFHPDRVAEILSRLDQTCECDGCPAPDCIGVLFEVSSEAIADGTKSKSTAPTHRFFKLCSEYCRAVTSLFDRLTHELLAFAKTELPKRKAQARTITFDDLIMGLRDALAGPLGPKLAKSIGLRYRAALIDEFQDTDPAQYEIFCSIFGKGQHCLFYIGDPKQAIFGFRGADIFTYRRAANASTHHAYTLTTNWRSEPKLLDALNTLYKQARSPFGFDWIDYHDVHPPDLPAVEPLADAKGGGPAALRLRLIPSGEAGKQLTNDEATERIGFQLAADIAELHASGAVLRGRPLRYSDIAVLVRKNYQAETLQELLRKAGIRSILRTESNVFAALEAEELDRFLRGVLEPRRESAFKGALATSLLGLDAHGLYELEADDAKRQGWLERFLGWQEQWVNGCFIAVFRRLLVEQSVRVRLVNLPLGERRLTNFLQLAELLHEAETARRLAPDAVCAFLSDQRLNVRTPEEHYQLRLESDQDAVQIVTVHKAKGLEYPIVFCPFLWQAETNNRPELLFHDRDHDDRLTLDRRGKKGGDARHKDWQDEESLAEELRLSYVALTRAMNRCYVYVPEARRILDSPLAHLLAADERHPIHERVIGLIQASSGSVDAVAVDDARTILHIGHDAPSSLLAARAFSGRIPTIAMSASFSGLNADVELDRELAPEQEADPDLAEVPVEESEGSTIFTFPKGAAAGDFFHDVLEDLDFKEPDAMDALVSAKLRLHGFTQPEFLPVVSAAISKLRDLELEPGIRLKAIARSDMLRELDFTYPLNRLTPSRFREILWHCPDIEGAVSERMGRLQFRPVDGYMRGFIDLLFRAGGRFYIIDWKSNWLGPRPTDYQPTHVRAEMLRRNYHLQYHLYTLATDLFLEGRLPGFDYERDFGGVFYVFLRGVDPARPQQGIFQGRPSARTLASLRQMLR